MKNFLMKLIIKLLGEIMEKLDLYRCEICGNIVEIVLASYGEIVCCGEPMKKLEPKQEEQAMMEKHVPIFVRQENGDTEIRIGEVMHPMLEEHHIMFIEVISNDKNKIKRKYLYPSDEPKMLVKFDLTSAYAREYCNIHELWEGRND